MNKNCIIFGNEEKISDNKTNNINVKYIYPLRELEICLDNSFPNSLKRTVYTNMSFNFRSINRIFDRPTLAHVCFPCAGRSFPSQTASSYPAAGIHRQNNTQPQP